VDLSLKLAQLQKSLEECRPESELNEIEQQHITRLHDYNDIKDLGQMLMGRLGSCLHISHSFSLLSHLIFPLSLPFPAHSSERLPFVPFLTFKRLSAMLEGALVKDMYGRFGMELED
jgi:hypothetical protein